MKNTSHSTYKLFPIFLFSLLLLNACTSDELPEPTEPTFPYFQMEVDGELWEPSGVSIGGGTPFDVTYRPDPNGFISISSLSDHESITNLNFSARNAYLNESVNTGRTLILEDRNLESGCKLFGYDSLNTFKNLRIVEFDDQDRKIKVEFEFDCFNECGDIHRIRKGVVHVNYM